jgi:hypothetical protein
MQRLKALFRGGSEGNEQLTAILAALLLVLLAVEGATLLRINSLLTVHAFVGMLLIPIVALKLASTGWRMVRYYLRGTEYIRRGPPHRVLRTIVAPVTAVSTIVLFGTGVALLAVDQVHGALVGLHKASFVVWFGAMTIHVLTRIGKLGAILRRGTPGVLQRIAVVTATVGAGMLVAVATLPAADHLQDHASQFVGVNDR